MTMDEFQRSLEGNEPPADFIPALTALWWDARGNWERTHAYAQDDEGAAGAWVHAYARTRALMLKAIHYFVGGGGGGAVNSMVISGMCVPLETCS
jgi:hypothetical protein